MTYIEFFDKNSIENLCACLTMLPKEVILVGDNETAMKRHIEDYQTIFKGRGQEVKFSYKKVFRWKVSQIIGVLEQIIQDYEDCVFGITGGDELVVFALGIVCERYADKNIQVHKISINNNKVYDCDMDGETIGSHMQLLSVEENIRIYGGEIKYSDVSGENTYRWDMTSDFETNIEDMWSICQKDTRAWNIQIGVFGTIKEVGTLEEDGLTIKANVADVKKYYEKHAGNYSINHEITGELLAKGLLTCLDVKADTVSITCKDLQVKRCLTQAGLALEMKIYKMARELKAEDEKALYNDVMNGVQIDWDGIIREEDGNFDTTNEIDVMLMHNMLPIFISCKNGNFKADELYKLTTVAERFGGKYAKKALVASALEDDEWDKILKQRAQDMGIVVIDKKDVMNDNALKKKLENLWR